MLFIPSVIGIDAISSADNNDLDPFISSNTGVKLIRPKPGFLYLFNIIEIPIASPSPIVIGEITCVAEQIPVYPFTVKWEFIDWQYGTHKFQSDNFSSPFWRYTYSNFNFGTLHITASFENTAGTVMSSDFILAKKFL
jgi:hypothetical protein